MTVTRIMGQYNWAPGERRESDEPWSDPLGGGKIGGGNPPIAVRNLGKELAVWEQAGLSGGANLSAGKHAMLQMATYAGDCLGWNDKEEGPEDSLLKRQTTEGQPS